jgi:hypothetical protein
VVELVTAKSIPVPESGMVWFPALSVSVSVPLPLPASMGENVTLMAQLAPTATEPPQLLVSAKGPDRVILRGLSAALPVLVSVIICRALLVETV